ncbi:HAD-IB family hydrolase [Phenylobacterium sp.]|uniref:HAD-IB family hydrolase n=1 Tax=Phenylobacterium sp. TaxID=1871053 RepID=UPI00374DE901
MAQDQPAVQTIAAAPDEPPVVAFDFDGTLTVRDSFIAFLKWRAGRRRYLAGLVRLLPAVLAYLFHRDRGRIKAAAVREYLQGVPRDRLEADAREFAELFSRSLLRPDAVEVWKRWRSDHVRLVIVTASPDLTVAPFARGLGADALIGTQLAFDAQDRVSGTFETPNCRGLEKVTRLRRAFGPDVVVKAAYGDTSGDREMLAMSEMPGYRVFKGTP